MRPMIITFWYQYEDIDNYSYQIAQRWSLANDFTGFQRISQL